MRIPLLGFLLLTMVTTNCTADETRHVRVATFNIAMGFDTAGEMGAALEHGEHERLQQVAAILQRVRPDIVLLNEFDYDPSIDAAALFNENYLARSQDGHEAIAYSWHFRAEVNTGVDSGLDLDGDGRTGGPGDAWGFGHFPGQYGMLVLSRFPIDKAASRTFRAFPWSSMPGASRPLLPDGSAFYPDETWGKLRLSSKSHWDLVFSVGKTTLHLLASHPTPPVFDGPEDRNGARNFDEIRFWREYTARGASDWIVDDQGRRGGIEAGARFVIAGDLNSDPNDGDSRSGAIAQLLDAPWIRSNPVPSSTGGVDATREQAGVNATQSGDPAHDTADFNDRYTGNLRLDYVLPSSNLEIIDCGVYWPAHGLLESDPSKASDHRLVWLDIAP